MSGRCCFGWSTHWEATEPRACWGPTEPSWAAAKEQVGAEMGRRIVELHDVLTRILRVYSPRAASMWLVGSEPLLGGVRPIDVLVTEGAPRVIRAIEGIDAGVFA